jgi:alpha-1,6-mannosyltransferase
MLDDGRPWVAAGLALLAVVCTAGMMHGRATSDLLFYASALAQSAVAAAAGWFGARARGRATILLLVGAAIGLRAFLIFEPPSLSTDVYRYVWDGMVVNARVNPYTHIPDDPALAYLRDPAIFDNITRRDYAVTIYPPVAEGFFALVTRISASLTAMKLALTLAEGVAVLALLRLLKDLGRPRGLVFGYLLHPAPLWEIAGNGHVDALAMAFLYSAFAWGGGAARPYLSGALLTFGALAKPAAALGLPGVWRPFQIALPLFAVALGLACYLPFLGAGAGVLGFLPIFVREHGMDTGDGFYWIALLEQFRTRPPGAAPVYYALSGALLLGLALVSRWRTGVDLRKSLVATARLLVASLLILTPGLPWYFLMALPMTALLGWSAPFVMCSVAFSLYDFNYDFAGDAPPFFARWSVAVGVGAAATLADALRTPGKGVRS